jgi:hypothetical protein
VSTDAVDAALNRYRELQDAEGATMADEMAIARAQGEAWAAYLSLCTSFGVEPESADNPSLGRY